MDTNETVEPEKGKGLKRIILAVGYSCTGIASACKHEKAFLQEFVLALILIPLAIILPFSLVETSILLASIAFVLVVELLNSSVEWTIDYISLDRHPFAKRAKDMASAAVFISVLNCIVIWSLFLFEKRVSVLDLIGV